MSNWMRSKQPDSKHLSNQPSRQSRLPKSQPSPAQSASTQLPAPSTKPESPLQVLQLQHMLGNRAVQRLIQPTRSEITPIGPQGGEVDGGLQSQINQARGGGRPLDKQTSAKFGSTLGANFQSVRVHTDSQSETINRSLGAEAATVGNDIFFSPGAYQPDSASGQKLLAHELTHVAQQGGSRVASGNKVQTKLRVGSANDTYERQADQVAGYSAGGGFSKQAVTSGLTIQRKLKFKPEELGGTLSGKAALKGKFGMKSTYAQIQDALIAYWNVKDGEEFEQKQRARTERLVLLRVLNQKCQKWLTETQASKKTSVGDIFKEDSLKKLADAVKVELVDEEYRAKYETPAGNIQSGLNEQVFGGDFNYARVNKKKIKSGEKERSKLSTTELVTLERYESLKKLGLTKSEIGALYSYTGEQFVLMNPAMAGDRGWLKSNMSKLKKNTSDETLDKAIETNLEIAKYAGSGLEKLPNWEQDRTIYRGETMPIAEGEALVPGVRKTFPHFVSTSMELMTPKGMIRQNASAERPYKVLYHITKTHKPGKDVSDVAKSGASEAEILFPGNTTFAVYKVLKEDKADHYKEVEVSTH